MILTDVADLEIGDYVLVYSRGTRSHDYSFITINEITNTYGYRELHAYACDFPINGGTIFYSKPKNCRSSNVSDFSDLSAIYKISKDEALLLIMSESV
jgi:hypothetical protein